MYYFKIFPPVLQTETDRRCVFRVFPLIKYDRFVSQYFEDTFARTFLLNKNTDFDEEYGV